MVTLDVPYLPDILRGVVQKVNAITSAYPNVNDRFTVGFNHGLLEQVGKDIYDTNTPDVLVWLRMNFEHERGGLLPNVFGETEIQLLIGCKTDNQYSQAERDTLSFKPKLLPTYQELLKQLDKTKEIVGLPEGQRKHRMRLNPYWGGGDSAETDIKNLWKEYIDAIYIRDLELKLKKVTHCP